MFLKVITLQLVEISLVLLSVCNYFDIVHLQGFIQNLDLGGGGGRYTVG